MTSGTAMALHWKINPGPTLELQIRQVQTRNIDSFIPNVNLAGVSHLFITWIDSQRKKPAGIISISGHSTRGNKFKILAEQFYLYIGNTVLNIISEVYSNIVLYVYL